MARILVVWLTILVRLPQAHPLSILLSTRGSQAANALAQKIGLHVVQKGPKRKKKKNKQKKKTAMTPTIAWSDNLQQLFWGPPRNNPPFQWVENDQDFPLLLLPGFLSLNSREKVKELLLAETCNEGIIEQHEVIHGEVSTIRRSLVSQLDPHGDALDLLLALLPDNVNDKANHPFEDGSVVSYRYAAQDFYAEHHDSYNPNETHVRTRQRAYTVLIYLQMPTEGPKENGGTEFTKLSSSASTTTTSSSSRSHGTTTTTTTTTKGLIVKPHTGDALIWPNFDRHGKPDPRSMHRALPVVVPPRRRQQRQRRRDQSVSKTTHSTNNAVGKVVINLWWEGRCVCPTDAPPPI